ncbi:MAG: flavin reductase family protein [Paracoccaceae bacterium]
MRDSDEIEKAVTRAEHAGRGHIPDPDNPRLLRRALGQFATGVTVITAREAGSEAPIGMTVNSFASVSLDPALVLWSAARASMRHAHFSCAEAFAIHILRADQAPLAERFARNQGFHDLPFKMNPEGAPILPDTLARLECVTEATHEGGDHTIIIGRVLRFEMAGAGEPLLFAQGQYGRFQPGKP